MDVLVQVHHRTVLAIMVVKKSTKANRKGTFERTRMRKRKRTKMRVDLDEMLHYVENNIEFVVMV